MAEYSVTDKIADEPAFNWWVRHVLRKRDRIINKVKPGYLRKTHKDGIHVLRSVTEAI